MKRIILFSLLLLAFTGYSQFTPTVGESMQEAADLRARVQDSSGTYQYNSIPHELDRLKRIGVTPIFAYIPAAVSTGSIYSITPTDGTGDFDVARNSTSYVRGESGYLEQIQANIAHIDYTDNGLPRLETHPA